MDGKNLLKSYWGKNEICSNCNLQQNTMKKWGVMECDCGCGSHSKLCYICAYEHSRLVENPSLYNKNTLCVMCAYIKCTGKYKNTNKKKIMYIKY